MYYQIAYHYSLWSLASLPSHICTAAGLLLRLYMRSVRLVKFLCRTLFASVQSDKVIAVLNAFKVKKLRLAICQEGRFYSWKRHNLRCIRRGFAWWQSSGMELITAEVCWISGSRNSAKRKGGGSSVSTQKRTDFSDNSHGSGSTCTASDTAELAWPDRPTTLIVVCTICSLLFFNSKFISPEFWVKQHKVRMMNIITPHLFPVWPMNNLIIWLSLWLCADKSRLDMMWEG